MSNLPVIGSRCHLLPRFYSSRSWILQNPDEHFDNYDRQRISQILLESAEFMKDLMRVPESTLRKTFFYYCSFVNIISIWGDLFLQF